MTFDKISELLVLYKQNIKEYALDLVVTKRLYAILVEGMENAQKHGFFESIKTKHSCFEIVVIEQDNHLEAHIGNYIDNNKVNSLIEKIDLVNSLDQKGLGRLYRATISTTRISEKGGAGLGIIEIARNSRQVIQYEMEKESENLSYLRLIITISKDPNKYK